MPNQTPFLTVESTTAITEVIIALIALVSFLFSILRFLVVGEEGIMDN